MSEPKFKVGDKVIIKGEIADVEGGRYPTYAVELRDTEIIWMVESDLTPAEGEKE